MSASVVVHIAVYVFLQALLILCLRVFKSLKPSIAFQYC